MEWYIFQAKKEISYIFRAYLLQEYTYTLDLLRYLESYYINNSPPLFVMKTSGFLFFLNECKPFSNTTFWKPFGETFQHNSFVYLPENRCCQHQNSGNIDAYFFWKNLISDKGLLSIKFSINESFKRPDSALQKFC